MQYEEEDYLMISMIQHFEFCRRQWALIHLEQLWEENLRTIEGEIMHKRAHNYEQTECRKGVVTTRGMAVHSHTLGISGVCDIVEFIRDDEKGYPIYKREGKYLVTPVEYKKGEPKEGLEDVMQVVLQAMCLEEMLCCNISKGYLYYGESRRRTEILITPKLRERARKDIMEMHDYYNRRYTPKVKTSKKCNACSLKNLCLPKLMKNISVTDYIVNVIGENG